MSEVDVLNFIDALFVTRYIQVATCALIIYEHITTLDLEVELIWKKDWSMVKILFLANRYIGDFVAIGYGIIYLLPLPPSASWSKTCEVWNTIQGWGSIIVVITMEGIMQYRISTMYGHSRRIIAFMVSCLLAELIVLTTLFGIVQTTQSLSTEPLPGVLMCTITSTPPWFYAIWIPIIIIEASLFVLALLAGIKYYRRRQIVRLQRHSGHSGLWYLLLRDSITFPFITVSVYLSNLIVFETLPPYWIESTVTFTKLACRILGCRLILNLREAYYLPFNAEVQSSTTTSTLVGMQCVVELETVKRSDAASTSRTEVS